MAATERLLVEIDRDSQPISGFVRHLDDPRQPADRHFSGYMELIAALDEVAATDEDEEP